jgi:hypothetical protein
VIAYKFLASGAVGPFTGFRWPTPGAAAPGNWVAAVDGRADHGVHACVASDLAFWLHEELWVAELEDPVTTGQRQVIGSRGRLLERVTGWSIAVACEYAQACAWRARDRFVVALRKASLGAGADRLASAGDLVQLRAASDELRARGAPTVAAAASSYLREAIETLDAGDAPVSAYISARAAVAASGGEESAFGTEREEQGWWLARRLGLGGSHDGSGTS